MRKFFKFQLYFSVLLIVLLLVYIFYNSFRLREKEKYSQHIISNYNITKLYSNMFVMNSDTTNDNGEINQDDNNIIGVIQISKINIDYPIFSTYTDELLKISPCRFYGPLPGEKGNLCIVGHNYDNDKFFSKISSLNNGDEIVIYNNRNKKFLYIVNNIYEVKPINLTPVYSYNEKSTELTLITCNNLNKNRIIIKAKIKK